MEIQSLPAYLIASPHLARPIDKKKAGEIAESIREIGLLSPLIVVPGTRVRNGTKTPGWDILAGNHRFEAMFRVLNWTEIPCIVTDAEGLRAELYTIDENLVRRELSDAERAYQTARRKEIYEALHPETVSVTVRGGPGRGKNGRQIGEGFVNDSVNKLAKPTAEAAERFTASTASATGRSERAVQREAHRGEQLGPTLNRIVGTSLDRGVEIDALATLPPEQREDLVSRAERGERVSARKSETAPNVVKIDTKRMHSVTAARRMMRDYLALSYNDRLEFDHLYAEHLRNHPDARLNGGG